MEKLSKSSEIFLDVHSSNERRVTLSHFILSFFISFFLYVHINFACSILFKRAEGDLKYLDQEIAGKNVLWIFFRLFFLQELL